MRQLSDYTQEEIDFVMDKFTEDWPQEAKDRTTLTDEDKLGIIQTVFGSMTLLQFRLRKIARESFQETLRNIRNKKR